MSVVLTKRGESKLRVLTKANDLATYTIRICSNEKHFPKRYRWCITSKIVESAIDINRYIKMANAIKITSDRDSYAMRKANQTRALATTYSLLSMIDIAYNTFGIEGSRIDYWTGLIIELQNLIRKWQTSNDIQFAKITANEVDS